MKTTANASSDELNRIADAYDRRTGDGLPLPVHLIRADRERHYSALLDSVGLPSRSRMRLLEVGCGGGSELHRFIKLGLRPENIVGVELLEERAAAARESLPPEVEIRQGDASQMSGEDGVFDVVFASTVFTSILDDGLQTRLAREMMRLVRPDGLILWYDFIYNNPRNGDVRGVTVRRIRELFPGMEIVTRRTTLAPPIARRVIRLGDRVYRLLHAIPLLRTHVVAAIRRPRTGAGP